MVVGLTPNIGLAKPDDTELAANWARLTEVCEYNNTLIADEFDIPLVSYTPVMVGAVSNPNIGSTGTIQGEYYDIQGFVMGNVVVTINGAGIAAGSGVYGISLPFVADSSFHSVETVIGADPGVPSVVGEGYLTDSSSVNTSGTTTVDLATVAGVTYARLATESFTGKGTSRNFSSTMPFVIAAGDQFSFNFLYKRV